MQQDMPIIKESTAKFLYVVISRSKSVLSGAIIAVTGDMYTHAALALDKELEFMYSFGRRKISNPFVGCFKRERLTDRFYTRHTSLPGVVLEIPVSQAQYAGVVSVLQDFLQNGDSYGYNIWGMMTAMFKYKESGRNKKFFCSEFVYYVLNTNGICDLGRPRSSVRPQHLLMLDAMPIFEGNLLKYPHYSNERAAVPLPLLT